MFHSLKGWKFLKDSLNSSTSKNPVTFKIAGGHSQVQPFANFVQFRGGGLISLNDRFAGGRGGVTPRSLYFFLFRGEENVSLVQFFFTA